MLHSPITDSTALSDYSTVPLAQRLSQLHSQSCTFSNLPRRSSTDPLACQLNLPLHTLPSSPSISLTFPRRINQSASLIHSASILPKHIHRTFHSYSFIHHHYLFSKIPKIIPVYFLHQTHWIISVHRSN